MKKGTIDYIVVKSWMVSELKLSGSDLLIFAIIYGFSQDERSAFYGSFNTISNTIGVSKRTVIRSIDGLEKKGFITKVDVKKDGISSNGYRVIIDNLGSDILTQGSDILSKSGDILSQPTIYKNINKTNNSESFKKPSIEEVESYCLERGNGIDAGHFIDHYESNGWMVGKTKMKDWKAAVRTWERRQYNSTPSQPEEDDDINLPDWEDFKRWRDGK